MKIVSTSDHKVLIRWHCEHCQAEHLWRWDEWDAKLKGHIKMRCDKCKQSSAMEADGRGNFEPTRKPILC